MKKNTINVRELVQKYQANCDRINEIADACETEQRERTEAENKEFDALTRENQLLGMRMQAATADYLRENPNAQAQMEKLVRENLKSGRTTEITLVREGEFTGMMVADDINGGIVPLRVQDFLEPLIEGFILKLVGLPMPTGLSGDFVWPIYDIVEASIAGEGVALTDSKINLSKLTATPERIGIAIPVTNQAINQSAGIIETLVKKVMPEAVALLLNKIVFGLDKVSGASHLVGPFAHIVAKGGGSATTEDNRFADMINIHEVPTFTELNAKMKAKVLESGIEGNHLCWVMTKTMKAILEGGRRDLQEVHLFQRQHHLGELRRRHHPGLRGHLRSERRGHHPRRPELHGLQQGREDHHQHRVHRYRRLELPADGPVRQLPLHRGSVQPGPQGCHRLRPEHGLRHQDPPPGGVPAGRREHRECLNLSERWNRV